LPESRLNISHYADIISENEEILFDGYFLATKRMSSDHKRWHLFYYKRVSSELSLRANQLRMIKDIRYPFGAVFISLGEAFCYPAVDAAPAELKINISELLA
jgi:hypothetical protein